jgi:hypothetical protein
VLVLLEEQPDPLEQLRRDLAAPALGPEDLLQLELELGVSGARVAADEVLFDLRAQRTDELTVEVELDLLQHVLALSR